MTPAQRGFATLVALFAGLLTGCGVDKLPTSYGHRRGAVAKMSVNGFSVLSDMFEANGWQASSWRRLSPKLREADAIIWGPNSFAPPTDEQVDWLQQWLDDGYGRTLVLMGRGYDAAPEYWRRVIPNANAEELPWMEEQQKQADYVWKSDLRGMGDPEECRWYRFRPLGKTLQVDAFGDDEWAREVDAKAASVVLSTDVDSKFPVPSGWSLEVLLSTADGELIAYRITDNNNQIIVIANGSFLLNLPLVNKENRKLAGHLIESCGGDVGSGKVVFLEETPGRMRIYDQEPANDQRSGFTMLTIWPLGFLLLHLIFLGSIICFVAFPIFGRAKKLKDVGISDFGKHIQALGALIGATENRNYALERLKHYEEHVRRESREN